MQPKPSHPDHVQVIFYLFDSHQLNLKSIKVGRADYRSDNSMSPAIHTLPAIASTPGDTASLKDQIADALRGNGQVTIPGDQEEDKRWAFKRSVPTVVLYDEQGLRWV